MLTIELDVLDSSCLQVAHAICKRSIKVNTIKEGALIDLEEIADHINAFVRAERKALELEKERAGGEK